RYGRAVPHVRLEDGAATGLHLGLRGFDERDDESVKGVLRAVVGVQSNRDPVVLGSFGGEGGEGEGTGCPCLDTLPGEVVCTTGGDLDDSVRSGLCKTLQHRVDGLR